MKRRVILFSLLAALILAAAGGAYAVHCRRQAERDAAVRQAVSAHSAVESQLTQWQRQADQSRLVVTENGRQIGVYSLEELGLSLENRSDFEQLAKLYQQFHNATRMRCNRGYTPHELFQMYPPDERMPKSLSFGPNILRSIAEGTMKADELRKGVLAMDLPDEALRISILKNIADAEKGAEQPSKAPRVGRNDPCPCGSGKKYKRCCGR